MPLKARLTTPEKVLPRCRIPLGLSRNAAGLNLFYTIKWGMAKGLCFSLEVPLIALPTLKVLAAAAGIKEGLSIPMLDARRMEVYSAVLNTELEYVRETEAEILTPDSSAAYKDQGPLTLVGSGAEKARELLSDPVFRFQPEIQPSARFMGPMAYAAFEAGSFEDLAYFEPYYLKDFIATRK